MSTATATATGRLRLGRYTLELDHPGGTTLELSPGAPETEATGPLRAALAAAASADAARATPRAPDRLERANDLIDQASEVTDRVENVLGVLGALTHGRLPEAGLLAREGDDVLAALKRLDRAGHFAELVKLGRPACRLFALTLRWAALVESLRLVLHAGEALADTPVRAAAEHELGTLHLVAGNREHARELLESARDRRARIGDHDGLAATEHNLRLVGAQDTSGSLRRPLILVGCGSLALVLALVLGLASATGGGTANSDLSSATTPAATTSIKSTSPTGRPIVAPGPGKPVTTPGAGTLTEHPATLSFVSQAQSRTSPAKTVMLRADGGTVRIGRAGITGPNFGDFATTVDTCSGRTLAAGSTCLIGVTFTAPATSIGIAAVAVRPSPTVTAALSISNRTSADTAQITLSGSIGPAVKTPPIAVLSASSATFGKGGPTSQTFTLTNSGGAPLVLSAVTVGGANGSDFEIAPGSDGCSHTTVAPNQSCSVIVSLSPTFTTGPADGWLSFSDTAASSPQSATLQVLSPRPLLVRPRSFVVPQLVPPPPPQQQVN